MAVTIQAALLILVVALLIDIILGDPPNRLHPTAWIGRVTGFLANKIRRGNPLREKVEGAVLAVTLLLIITLPLHYGLLLLWQYASIIIYIISVGVFLKLTFAVKGMERHALPIAEALRGGRFVDARLSLSLIVRRETSSLDEPHIVSGAVESVAESIVDGVASPLLYYAFLGMPGAVGFRVINTLDSMVAYKDRRNLHVGWLPAKLDTLANYVPARLTALYLVVSALILREDWRRAWRILKRDRGRTESRNAGWPMSAMAGALGVRLEKIGAYTLGDEFHPLSWEHIPRALRMMRLVTVLFTVTVIALLYLLSMVPLINGVA